MSDLVHDLQTQGCEIVFMVYQESVEEQKSCTVFGVTREVYCHRSSESRPGFLCRPAAVTTPSTYNDNIYTGWTKQVFLLQMQMNLDINYKE